MEGGRIEPGDGEMGEGKRFAFVPGNTFYIFEPYDMLSVQRLK